jgi:hypothetical protein
MILVTEWSIKNSPIAAPERMDLVPMSIGPYPKVSNPPRRAQEDLRCLRSRVLGRRTVRDPASVVLIVVLGFALGKRRCIRWTREESWVTGQRTESPLRVWVRLSSLHPFFWFWKVSVTYRDWLSSGSWWETI